MCSLSKAPEIQSTTTYTVTVIERADGVFYSVVGDSVAWDYLTIDEFRDLHESQSNNFDWTTWIVLCLLILLGMAALIFSS